jgi:hypothetical protein
MSAHLTVYTMAIEAERPLRLREADQERLAAQADTGLGQRTNTLLRRLGGMLRRSWWSGVSAAGWSAIGSGQRSVLAQPVG